METTTKARTLHRPVYELEYNSFMQLTHRTMQLTSFYSIPFSFPVAIPVLQENDTYMSRS